MSILGRHLPSSVCSSGMSCKRSPPVSPAWGAFGLVLFEYGLMRKITQFRYQAYVVLIAAFTRIFFVNLTASEPGEFWGPRMYTILPLVLIFFFVYAQLPNKEENTSRDRRLHFDVLLAYLGTATLVALFYFQFQSNGSSPPGLPSFSGF